MLKRFAAVVILFVQISIFAQDYKFGKVSKQELEEKYYAKDSTADAAYLYKKRRTYYTYNNGSGFEILNEIYIRLKIYKEEGFNYATFKLPYFSPESGKSEKISSIKAYTYNLDDKGKIKEDKASWAKVCTFILSPVKLCEPSDMYSKIILFNCPETEENSIVLSSKFSL